MISAREDRSLGELFSELSTDTSTLISKEMELARHEMTRSVTSLARNSAMTVAGGLVAYLGAIILLIGLGWLLVEVGLDAWLAFLLVGAITAAIGAFLVYRGMQSMKEVNVVPERTVETIRQDVEWAKDQAK